MSEKVTIINISEETGVSPSTVSRIINGKGKYTQETIDKVNDAIQRLNYSPNIIASTLRSRKSSLVGIITPYISNEFFATIVEYLVKDLTKRGFSPMICVTYNDEKTEEEYGKLLNSLNASGIVYFFKETDVLQDCKSIPSVFIGSSPSLTDNSVSIQFDIIGGAKIATEELIHQNCKKILYIESRRRREQQLGRYLGFQQALWENGIPEDKSLIVSVGSEENTLISALESLLNEGKTFDAIFSNTLSNSIDAINYLSSRGICIPDDIKLVAFENDKIAEYYNSGITAIEMDPVLTSKFAAECLTGLMNEGFEKKKSVIRIPAKLIQRNSTK